MSFSALSRLLMVAILAATPLALTPWHAAHAQDADEAEAEQEAMEAQRKAEARKAAKHAAPPSALPGAEQEDQEDPSHAKADLNPTSALFDAINRGSLNAAKESLNRGADMNAHNILGQTPLDMAIDLNRNDIMFLLLSMRTYNPDGRLDTDVSSGLIDVKNGAGHLDVKGHTSMTAPAPVARPHFDLSGGTPNPGAGFLGFASR